MKYPECDKMKSVQPRSQLIGEFLEWLNQEKGVTLAKLHEHNADCFNEDGERDCGMCTQSFYPIRYTIENLLAEFFEIDLEKVEREKRAMLKELREKA